METVAKGGGISFIRTTGKVLGNTCDACDKKDTIKDEGYGLLIDLTQTAFTLCPYHEGILLEKLINNFIKRARRGSRVGFLGPIQKTMGPVKKDED